MDYFARINAKFEMLKAWNYFGFLTLIAEHVYESFTLVCVWQWLVTSIGMLVHPCVDALIGGRAINGNWPLKQYLGFVGLNPKP